MRRPPCVRFPAALERKGSRDQTSMLTIRVRRIFQGDLKIAAEHKTAGNCVSLSHHDDL